MFGSKPKTISFADARRVLVAVLSDVDCRYWEERIAASSAESFPSLLGGMGSFSDLIICPENHHKIAADREPLANELVSCMSSVCYSTSREGPLGGDAVVASCGTISLVLTGWRCLVCGHARTTLKEVRALIAAIAVRRAIRDGVDQGTPVDTLVALWQSPEDSDSLRQLVERAMISGIVLSGSEGWVWTCPACGGNDTCMYRWRDDGRSLVPTDDNLPLRIRR